ncbi:NAD-dependent epimerase/dehydratase family protein [Simiduia agarivorans]|uniref:NAD dependent epimerase/dehydratase-like protein n=1 Tax=Simiduia agarivorans (strain DSM 21679 / JCM 13881 / BCRC 17597 / SA1) TaxID=1117647 RepID=K4KFC4_SIMAS|nr:NAD-dependent epimerase/dehydratase family protein [Simiduia agarivorans]AFU97764.1 NAD dependent epimerase/dehydratase-like protein [Simiduia agarivorans SA1 = DSM 21679]
MRVAVTGANGFVGQALTERLEANHVDTIGLVRPGRHNGVATLRQTDYRDKNQLRAHLSGCHTVIHLIGKAHSKSANAWQDYCAVNVDLTLEIATAALMAGARRFIYLSSIKALGENTPKGRPFDYATTPHPQDNYGKSKLAAEHELQQFFKDTAVELIIVRPPLIWGKNPKGNLASLLKWAKRGIPLPLAGIQNQRHWVSIDLLCEFLTYLAISRENLAELPPLLIADPAPLSTSDAIQKMARANNVPLKMFSLSMRAWKILQHIPLARNSARKLSGNLEVDATQTNELTGWQPAPAQQEQVPLRKEHTPPC